MARYKDKSKLEKTVMAGIHGTPQLKIEERRRYLGFFRERVLQAVTFEQIGTPMAEKALKEAIADGRAKEFLVHGKASQKAMPLVRFAREQGLDFTITNNPKFVGGVAAVVVADHAVDMATLVAEEDM